MLSKRSSQRSSERRRNRRKVRSGLLADFGDGALPVFNYSIDGILIGDYALPVQVPGKIMVTLSWADKPRLRLSTYCQVARIDRFRNETAFSFASMTEELFDFIERTPPRPKPAAKTGLRRFF